MLIMPHFGKTAEPRTRVAEGSRLGHQTGVWTRSQWPVPSRKRITRPGGTEARAVPPGVGAEALISPPALLRGRPQASAGALGGAATCPAHRLAHFLFCFTCFVFRGANPSDPLSWHVPGVQ